MCLMSVFDADYENYIQKMFRDPISIGSDRSNGINNIKQQKAS